MFDSGKSSQKNEKEKVENKAEKADRELYKISTAFPFIIFPDHLIIDTGKVSIVRHGFLSNTFHSVFINDISDVLVYTSLLFATIEIIDKYFYEKSVSLTHLNKKEAMKARRLIQGLIIAKNQDIDLTKITDIKELSRMLEKMGASGDEQEKYR